MGETQIAYKNSIIGEYIIKQFNTILPDIINNSLQDHYIKNNLIKVKEIDNINKEEIEEEEEYLSEETFDFLKRRLRIRIGGYPIEKQVAFIYGLWQDYYLSDKQVEELYLYVDPYNKYADVEDYYDQLKTNRNPLKELIESYEKRHKES